MKLAERFKNAINAFRGKRVIGNMHFGIEMHKCNECEHKNPYPEKKTMVFYICDRKACAPCDNPDCRHTHKIEHAKNFKSNEELGKLNGYSDYWEVDPLDEVPDASSYYLTPQDDETCPLYECPVGLFEFEGILGMKTEYCTAISDGRYKIDAYVVSSGERFCISNDAMVKPCALYVAK